MASAAAALAPPRRPGRHAAAAPVDSLPPGQRQLSRSPAPCRCRPASSSWTSRLRASPSARPTGSIEVIDELQRDGVAVVYISHRLAEVKRLADRVDGAARRPQRRRTARRPTINHDALVRLMVGRDLKQFYPARHAATADAAGAAGSARRALRRRPGRAGVVRRARRRGRRHGRAGRRRPHRTGRGAVRHPPRRGRATCCSTAGRSDVRRPRDAIAAGLLLVPEDRRHHGLVLEDSVRDNSGLPNLDRLSLLRLVSPAVGSGAGPRPDRSGCGSARRRRGQPVGQLVRRQPAEGGAGQVAGPPARGC